MLQADLKELDLPNTNPKVVKRLTAAVQSVNKAHTLTEKAKELSTCSLGRLLTGTLETSRRTSACRSWTAPESPRPG